MQKVTALLTAVLALSLVMASGLAYTLGDYPSFCVSDHNLNCYIVVGADAKPEDVASAIDLGLRLAGESYEEVSTTGGVTTAVSGGVDLSTVSTKLYYGSSITAAKDTLTSSDLPSVLASGSVVGDSGTEYKYNQYIILGSTPTIAYGVSGTSLSTATPYIDLGSTSKSAVFYNDTILFTKPLNVSGSDVDGKVITLFGKEYTLGSGSELSTTQLTLYGGGEEVTIRTGEEPKTVTIGGVEHTISLTGVTSGGTASIVIDGTSKDVTQGSYVTIGGTNVYVKYVHAYTAPQYTGDVVLRIGAGKVVLKNNDYVRTGTTEETIKGTNVEISSSGGKITKIVISVFKPDATNDIVTKDNPFYDPVFGTFKVDFEGFSPALDAETRDIITLGTSGDNTATLTFTDYNGVEKTIEVASNYWGGSAQSTVNLTDSNGYLYHVVENETAGVNDYIIINQGGFSHLLQVSTFDLTATTPTVTLVDVFSGETYKVTFPDGNVGSTATTGNVIDGKTYTILIASNTTDQEKIAVSWSGSGTKRVVYPVMRGKNGEFIALTKPVNITVPNSDTGSFDLILPSGTGTAAPTQVATVYYNSTAKTIVNVTVGGTADTTFPYTVGQVDYDITLPTATKLQVSLNATTWPALFVREEKAKQGSSEVYNAIIAPISVDTTGTPYKIIVDSAAPTITGTDSGEQKTTDTKIKKALDVYGTLVTRNTDGQGTITISYPDNQAVALAYVLTEAGEITTTTTGETIHKVVPVTTPLAKLDTEIPDPAATDKNLIVVGGPAVNRLAATLMNLTYPTYGASGLLPFSEGEGYIKVYNDAFGVTGKTAILVAGWSASDTANACHVLQQYDTFADQLNANTAVKVTSVTAAGITPA